MKDLCYADSVYMPKKMTSDIMEAKMTEYRQWKEKNRTLLKDVIPLDTPFSIMIEASSLCNARCVYCAHSIEHKQYEGNMSLEMMKKILTDIKAFPNRIKKCDLFGFGEPFCNPNLARMIRMIHDNGKIQRVDFTTNGLLFTKKRVDEVIAAGVDTIRVSLQGLDAAAYKKVCGVTVDFEKFLANLQYLYQNKGQATIRMKIADIAIQEMPNGKDKFEKIFQDIADSLYIEHILPYYAGVDYSGLGEKIQENAKLGREGIFQTKINKVCQRPFYRIMVRANGDITAACCDSTRDVKFGNIITDNLFEVWNGKIRQAFLLMQLEGKRFNHPSCKDCVTPNDIGGVEDILDPWADEILKRF